VVLKSKQKADVKKNKLISLTNQFYTCIPHNFGGKRVLTIESEQVLRKRMETLEALLDIEVVARLLKDSVRDHLLLSLRSFSERRRK